MRLLKILSASHVICDTSKKDKKSYFLCLSNADARVAGEVPELEGRIRMLRNVFVKLK